MMAVVLVLQLVNSQLVSPGVFLILKAELYHKVKRFKPSTHQILPVFTMFYYVTLSWTGNLNVISQNNISD